MSLFEWFLPHFSTKWSTIWPVMVCGGAGEARFLPHSSWCLALLSSPAPSHWLLYLWPVAEMCGINHGLFYYHFWNVSELWKPMMLHNFTAKHNVDADKGCLPHSQFGAEASKVFQALFPMLVNILRNSTICAGSVQCLSGPPKLEKHKLNHPRIPSTETSQSVTEINTVGTWPNPNTSLLS